MTMVASKETASGSRVTRRKAAARGLLAARDQQGLRQWVRENRNPLRTLTALLYDSDHLICRRAVEALGIVAGLEAERNLENVRRLVRHLLWTMNDESGSICWYAPEAIGEVLINVPSLIDEYGPLLVTFLQEEPFERGAHWAVARVASLRPDIYRKSVDRLAQSLDNPDPNVRGYALAALTLVDAGSVARKAELLKSDAAGVSIYDFDTGTLKKVSVASLVENLLASVE